MKLTKFNPENKSILTYGEALKPAMEITDQEDADQYLADYVKYQQSFMSARKDGMTAEQMCKTNLGYFAGYYDREVMSRVNRLFKCSHPVFGTTSPTNEEAFEAGKKQADLLSPAPAQSGEV